MSKKDLIDAVAEATELSKDKAGVAVEAVIKHIEKTMKNGSGGSHPGLRHLQGRQPQGPQGPQPADRRRDDAEGGAGAQVPGLEEPQGHAELSGSDIALAFSTGAPLQRGAPFCFGSRQ